MPDDYRAIMEKRKAEAEDQAKAEAAARGKRETRRF